MGVDVDAIVCRGVDLGTPDEDERYSEERREELCDLLWDAPDYHLEPVHYCNLYENYTAGLIIAVRDTVQEVCWRVKPLDTTPFNSRVETSMERHARDELRELGIDGELQWLLAARQG